MVRKTVALRPQTENDIYYDFSTRSRIAHTSVAHLIIIVLESTFSPELMPNAKIYTLKDEESMMGERQQA